MTVDDATIAFAHRLADASGAVIRPLFRQRIDVAHKDGRHAFDPVTEADKGAERAIRELLARERPDDGILGEEYGEQKGTSGYRWVLDPVDGTRAFITGRHEWGSLIALEKGGAPVLGILDQPVLGERFISAVNGSASLRCRRGKTTSASGAHLRRHQGRHPLRHRSVGLFRCRAAGRVSSGSAARRADDALWRRLLSVRGAGAWSFVDLIIRGGAFSPGISLR